MNFISKSSSISLKLLHTCEQIHICEHALGETKQNEIACRLVEIRLVLVAGRMRMRCMMSWPWDVFVVC